MILQIIQTIIFAVADGILAFFATYAFFTLRRQQRDIHGLKVILFKVYALSSASSLRDSFRELNKLEQLLGEAVENEDFDAAEKLKDTIHRQREETERAVKAFNETFGDLADVTVFKMR